jgi:hypothetical protein
LTIKKLALVAPAQKDATYPNESISAVIAPIIVATYLVVGFLNGICITGK